jgi:hypothetical protein
MNICRGCQNEFKGHSTDLTGAWCERCGTKNYKEKTMEIYKPSLMRSYVIESDSVDGDIWFAHYDDFTNVQESDECAFGKTPQEALQNFIDSRVLATQTH